MPTPTEPIPQPTERQQRNFWKKVDKDGPRMPHMDTNCWDWTGCKNWKGYGQVNLGSKLTAPHRVSLVLSGGQFTAEKPLALHKCDRRHCVRPDHIFSGSALENTRDMFQKGRANPPAGERNGLKKNPDRAPCGTRNANAKLNDERVKAIRHRHHAGESALSISNELGLSHTTVWKIVKRKAWKHVK